MGLECEDSLLPRDAPMPPLRTRARGLLQALQPPWQHGTATHWLPLILALRLCPALP